MKNLDDKKNTYLYLKVNKFFIVKLEQIFLFGGNY